MVWLRRDERRLLSAYAFSLGRADADGAFHEDGVSRVLYGDRRAKRYDEDYERPLKKGRDLNNPKDLEDLKRGIKRVIIDRNRVDAANHDLASRGLVAFAKHEPMGSVYSLSLTSAGYDQGRKYASRLSSSQEWWLEHKDHWIVKVIGATGVIGLVGLLFRRWLGL